MFKNKLENYFVSELLKSYFFVLFILSLLFWITQSSRFLYLITDTGLSINNYLSYILLLLPKTISQLILISFLIGIFMNIIKFKANKELEIFLLSGFGKDQITKLVIKISIFITLISYFFFIYLAPLSGEKSRKIIANAEFSFINSLVKQKNFNSPLKGLTIYVNKNDNKGNLEKIFIFENNKTIISKTGRVLNINDKNFLELNDGIIQEKTLDNKIQTVKFSQTMFDFTKYQVNKIITPKLQERNFFDIVREYKLKNNKNILYEIHKRLFSPLFLPIIAILCCFILYNNNEKLNLNKLKVTIFSVGVLFIIFLEILLNLSVANYLTMFFLYIFPFFTSFFLFLILKKFLRNETK